MQESFEDELDSNIESFLGKRLKMRFIDEDSSLKWYNGRIISFEPQSGQYGAYFPSDGQTIMINPLKEANDMQLLD